MVTALKIERTKKGIRQWRLAQMAHISQTELSQYECGRRRCPADVRHRIANALEVPVDILFPDLEG